MPVQVVLVTFTDENGAKQAAHVLHEARKAAKLDFDDTAVIRKDAEGALLIKDTDDLSSGQGAGRGAIIGGVIGLLAGPAGALVGAGAGALVGGILNRGDDGFGDEALEALGKKLATDSSALVAVVPEVWIEQFEAELNRHSSDVAVSVLDADVVAQLQVDAMEDDNRAAAE
jgi:uncharacterized membrane protein